MDYFIRRIMSSIGVLFRTIKAFFSRRLMGIVARLRQLTSVSRNAAKVANASVQGVAAAVKKPTKREDYIETKRLFISKSFLIFLVLGVILAGVFVYYVAWPFILSHFLTARFYVEDRRVEDWSGRVIVYSDKSKKLPLYSGKLEEGVLQGAGKEYDENGLVTYEGSFENGEKTGSGKEYAEGVLIYDGQFSNGVRHGSGRLYENGSILYEGQFNEGVYQGSGTLFENGALLYKGQFNEGVYEGSGSLYAPDGELIYQGQFHEGIYEGSGTSYENGAISYRGTFLSGVPNGMGTQYKDGEKRYEGSFSDGIFEGEGTLYYPGGKAVEYKGGFSGGVYEGEGTLYYPDGKTVNYKGGFSAGVFDGEGTFYNEDGSVGYTGSFAKGTLDGAGTVYLENGDRIESDFSAGTGSGLIKWYKNGRLWYDGGAVDLTPDGFGRIYSVSGKVIYQGEMDMGCVDGPWLLGLSAEELRDAFADADVIETTRNGGGFLIVNRDMGLTVLCTFRSDEGDPGVYRIWFYPEEGSAARELLPWKELAQAEAWAQNGRDGLREHGSSTGGILMPEGGEAGDWYQSVFLFETYSQSLVCVSKDTAPFEIVWSKPGDMDIEDTPEPDEAVSESQRQLSGLLEALEKIGEARLPGVVSGGGDVPGGETPGGASGPVADIEAMLSAVADMDEASTLMNALIDSCVNFQIVKALESEQPLLEKLLAEQQRLLSMGLTSEESVTEVQNDLNDLAHRIYQYNVMLEQSRMTAEALTGISVRDCDLSPVLLMADVSAIDAESLYIYTFEYKTALAAGQYEVNESELRASLESRTLDLALSYDSAAQKRESLSANQDAMARAVDKYARGGLGLTELYNAQIAVCESVVTMFEAMASYTRAFNSLNHDSGGWMAQAYNWFPGPYDALRAASIRNARDAAEPAAA